MKEQRVETPRGVRSRVIERGSGAPLLYLHGAGGLLDEEPLLDALAGSHHVYAAEWPGYGPEEAGGGEELLEDMLDFALHGWDLVEALGLQRPHVVGHSMGGMIAAEMACLSPGQLGKLVLVAPTGLWIDELPVPDLFAMLPFELARVLFGDPSTGEKFLTRGLDFSQDGALQEFMIGNSRRMGMAGKILFPIPNRRVSKRLYRQSAETLLLWGRDDAFLPLPYAERWAELLPNARLETLEGAGHMVPYEAPAAAAEAIAKFLA